MTAGAGVANGAWVAAACPVYCWECWLVRCCFSLLAIPLLPRLGAVRVSAYSAAAAVPMLLAAGLVVDGADRVSV